MITRAEADSLYNDNCFYPYTTLDALSDRIRTLSVNGAYNLQVRFETFKQVDDVRVSMYHAGFDVEPFNGHDDILDISWG